MPEEKELRECCYLNPIFDVRNQDKFIGFFCASSKPCVLDNLAGKKLETYLRQIRFYCPLKSVGVDGLLTNGGETDGVAVSNEA
jgi:hypothetical protein